MNINDFHFLRPWWLLALPAGLWLLRRNRRPTAARERWQRVCDAHLLDQLLTGESENRGRKLLPAQILMLLLAVLALAGPTWERRPQPLYRGGSGRVIVLDLSASMNCPDIPPSRLVRARYRAIDLVKAGTGFEQGLVVFAGDAFIVTPLTDDRKTLLNLMPTLDTDTVPAPGSRADRGLAEAGKLLRRAAISHGQVILIADDADELTVAAARKLKAAGHRVDVIAFGTRTAAPIPLAEGGYLKDRNGRIVVPVPDFAALQRTAEAGGGIFLENSAPESAFARLSRAGHLFPKCKSKSEALGDQWYDFGPWLLLPLLVMAAFSFRRGWLLTVIFILLIGPARPARAFTFRDLWLRRDQQAARALQKGDYQAATRLAADPEPRAAALYRANKFKEAAAALEGLDTARAHYNRGNALARAGELEEALKAYDRALKLDPDDDDARHNRELVEKLLKKQQQQQKNQQNNKSGQKNQKNKNRKDKNQGKGNQKKSSSQSQNQPSSSSQNKSQNSDKSSAKQKNSQNHNGEEKPQSEAEDRQTSSARKKDAGQKSETEKRHQADRKNKEKTQKSAGKKAKAEKKGSQPPAADRARESDTPHPDAKQQALEQWLRRIPDDPGGLLRRKFRYQYRERLNPTRGRQEW